jgi:diguanylate cyclase (GGDEF)-like protein
MRSLRSKILALACLLVAVTQLITIGAVLITANREISNRGEQSLSRAAKAAETISIGRIRRLETAVRELAANAALRTAVNGGAIPSRLELLESARLQAGVDLALIEGPGGEVLARTGSRPDGAAAYSGIVTLDAETVAGRSFIDVGGVVFELLTLPAGRAGNAVLLGVGLRVDPELADYFQRLVGSQVAMLVRTGPMTRIISTSSDGDPGSFQLAALKAGTSRYRRAERVTIAGAEHLAMLVPLAPGSSDVELLVSASVDEIMRPFRELRLTMLQLSTIALALAIIGSVLLSQTITRPLNQLLAAARRIRDGDYHQPLTIAAEGEFAEVKDTLNAMQESIAEREARITYQARFDALTGLPSRVVAIEALAVAARDGRDAGTPVSVVVIDLNRISELGSTLGPDIGGALLCQAAERLRASLDPRHTLARLESDQFVVILRGIDADDAQETSDDLLRLLNAGLSVRDVNVSCDAVAGIAAFPVHGDDAAQLMQRAALARNRARQAGRSVGVYEEGNEAEQVAQLSLLADLRRAARHDELRLYLQPKVRLSDGRICGAEALVRWQHPTFGFLTPDKFIPVAEQSGNISLITNWALQASVRECRMLQEEGLDLPISVNVSGRDLQNRHLPSLVLSLLRDHDLDARFLMMEITENAVIADFLHATHMLEHLRDLGIRIAVDDFGTGYSSLAQLKNLPVDELKIDRAFVRDLPGNRDDAAIVRATITLAHEMGLEVLAEGIENAEAMQWLQEQGCERAQGYLISKPIPAESFARWVRAYESDETRPSAILRVAS